MDNIYLGKELELFEKANTWKSYWCSFLRPYILREGQILEVGCGIGGNSIRFHDIPYIKWIGLEPDFNLCKIAAKKCKEYEKINIVGGNVKDLSQQEYYDLILYIDVLEHIEDDKTELSEAFLRLKSGGRIFILSPAFQFLYSEFDMAIGHYRRYNNETLKMIAPIDSKVEEIFYLDSVGLMLNAANKFLLKSSHPNLIQIKFWDKIIIPLSKMIDKIINYSIGKSIVMVIRKNEN